MRQILVAKERGNTYNHSVTLYDWQPHADECTVCERTASHKTGGRPAKKSTKRGRPKGTSVNQLVDHISMIATHSPPPALHHMELQKDMDSEVACHHCNKMLENPIELPCTHHACAACVKDRRLTSKALVCPHCNAEHPL